MGPLEENQKNNFAFLMKKMQMIWNIGLILQNIYHQVIEEVSCIQYYQEDVNNQIFGMERKHLGNG